MKKFLEEQDSAAQPPEPQGDQTPYEADQTGVDKESGETLPDETDSEEEEKVEWDGSETELVADDSAAEYEEQHTGIKLKYSLKSKEIFYALFKSRYTSTRIALSAVAVVLCAVMAVAFVNVKSAENAGSGTLSALCIILIFLILGLPVAHINSRSKELADRHEIKMKIYPDHIQMGAEETQWEIALDGTSRRTVFQNLLILYVDGRDMVILPLRCVEPSVLPEVQAMIFAGTNPIQ
jgi:hypothetical protein